MPADQTVPQPRSMRSNRLPAKPTEGEYRMLGAWLIERNLMGRTQVELGHHREVIDKVWTWAYAASVAETERRLAGVPDVHP
jgi:hypothetical protein